MKMNNLTRAILYSGMVSSSVLSVAPLASATEANDPQRAVIYQSGIDQSGITELETQDNDYSGSYWGIGIGSVLGAVIAGPPGAAMGATLGATFGWGYDKTDELEQNLVALHENKQRLKEKEVALQRKRVELENAQQKLSALNQSNMMQSARMAELMAQGISDTTNHENPGNDTAPEQEVLQNLAQHFAQEIYFRKGESQVPDYAMPRLDKLRSFLQTYPELTVTLKGYTDHLGTEEFNDQLAQARAESIRDVLLAQGVEAQRVLVKSLGESASNAVMGDVANYILDRRVSIELGLNNEQIKDQNQSELLPVVSLAEVTQ